MTSINDIKKSAEYTDAWLMQKQQKHVKMIERSIKKLQKSIENTLHSISVDNTGHIEGLKVNLKQAQKVHRSVENLFYNEFSRSTKNIVNDFKNTSKAIENSYSYLDTAVKFTSVDEQAMGVLRDGYYADWLKIGEQQKDKIIQGVYDQVIGGARFTDLVDNVRNALTADIEGIPGKSLIQYSRLYARDMIMDYQRNVNMMKGKELGFKHWLYMGNIIGTTRPFCKQRAGKTYTTKQIESWTYQWAGKKGPALQYCGGWNCRHHWVAVKPEWLDGEEKVDIGDWNLKKQSEALKKKIKPIVKPKPISKVLSSTALKAQNTKRMNQRITDNPELQTIPEQYHDEYMKYKNQYRKKMETWIKLQQDPMTDLDWRNATSSLYRHDAPNVYSAINDWQGSTTGKKSMALKFKAEEMEPNRSGKAFFRGYKDPFGYKAEIDKMNKTPQSTKEYLKVRAMNQAYMEEKGIDKVELYRGTDGDSGKTIADNLRASILEARSKAVGDAAYTKAFPITDNSLVGYTDQYSVGYNFGRSQDGFTIKRVVPREDIFVHRDLFGGSTGRFASEAEYIIFGGKIDVNFTDIHINLHR